MPLYAYRCEHGHATELLRAPERANAPARCDECGEPAKRLFKLRGIGFKGSGFHNTDYPKPGRVATED